MHIRFTPTAAVTIGSSDKISVKLGLPKNSGILNASIYMTLRDAVLEILAYILRMSV